MTLRDFLYVDTEKSISIYSQLTGGVVDIREHTRNNSNTSDNKRHYDFRVFKHDAGGSETKEDISKSVVKPHHALLTELEEALAETGNLVDFTGVDASEPQLADEKLRAALKRSFCIKAKGRALIEDYERIKKVGESFPEISGFINRCTFSNSELAETFSALEAKINNERLLLEGIKDKNKKSLKIAEITKATEDLESLKASIGAIGALPQWLIDGVSKWIDTYLPGIINLRIYPNPNSTAEHLIASLKREYIESGDLTYFHNVYGSFPTEELTIVGLITSVPDAGGESFNPLAEFDKDNLEDYESVEAGFRKFFRGFDGLENMIRTARYPRIVVYPLMVYRESVT